MKNLKLMDVPSRIVADALRASGIAEESIVEALEGIRDSHFNDPKEAGRFVTAWGGNRLDFFDALEGVDWGEE